MKMKGVKNILIVLVCLLTSLFLTTTAESEVTAKLKWETGAELMNDLVKCYARWAGLQNICLTSVSEPVSALAVLLYDFTLSKLDGEKTAISGLYWVPDEGSQTIVEEDYYKTEGRLFQTVHNRITSHPKSNLQVDAYFTIYEGLPYIFAKVKLTAFSDLTVRWREIWNFGGNGTDTLVLPTEDGIEKYTDTEGGLQKPCSVGSNWIRMYNENGEGIDIVFSHNEKKNIEPSFKEVAIRVFHSNETTLKKNESYTYGMIVVPIQFQLDEGKIIELANLYEPTGEFKPISLSQKAESGYEYSINTSAQGRFPIQLKVDAKNVAKVIDLETRQEIPFHFGTEHELLTMIVNLANKPIGILVETK